MKTILLSLALLFAGSAIAQIPTTGLRVHLKADAGTSTTTEGQGVTTWADQSGNGFNATAPAGQPLYNLSAINGQPALYFSGSQYLHIANTGPLGLVNSDYEMFFVAKSGNPAIQFLASGSIEHHEVHLNGAGGLRYIATPTADVNNGSNDAYTDGAQRIFGVRATATSGVARVNGVDVSTTANSRSSSDAMFRLGDRSSGGYPLYGHIAEVIIYNRVLSKIERNQVETYLAQKYGVTGAAANAPTVMLDPPSHSQQSGVTFSGTVNPNGAATTYRFLYGTDAANLTLSTEPMSAGSGSSAVEVSASIPGLSRVQTYHVALVAENAAQLARTSTQAFTVNAEPTGPATASLPISGLRVHLKADAGTSTTTEGQAVTQWIDQSGNGFIATSPTGGRPLYTTSTINGLPALSFGGSERINIANTSTIGLTSNDYEMFFVAKSGSGEIQFLASGAVPHHELHLNGSAGLRFIPINPVFIDNGSHLDFTDGVQRIFNARATSTNGTARVNGVDANLTAGAHSLSDAMFRLGVRGDNSYPLVGHLAEVLIYNRTLSANERTLVERYLSDKYAITSTALTRPSLVMNTPATAQNLSTSLSGTVNPNGVATSYRFVYGTDPDNLTESTEWTSVGSGTQPVEVNQTIGDLTRFETYYVKLVATTASQIVESALGSFDTSYLEVIGFGWKVGIDSESPQETRLTTILQLGVPNAAGSEFKIRYGSYETDFMPISATGGTFNETVWLPNENLVYGQSYELVLIGKGPTGKLTYSDTLTALYFGIPTVVLAAATPSPDGSVSVIGSVNPNGAATSYSIYYGTDLQSLTETALEALGNGTTAVSINRTLESLTDGQTYYLFLYAENDDFTVESDTLTFSTRWASADLDSVVADRETGARFYGRVNPNGFPTEYRFSYGGSATEWTDAGNGTSEIAVNAIDIPIDVNQTYLVVLEARTGLNIFRSDTLSLDTYFVNVEDVVLEMESEDPVQYLVLRGSVNSFGATGAEYRVLFGTDPDNLTEYSAYEPADNSHGAATIDKMIGGDGSLVIGTTYYAILQARSASGRTSTSDIQSIRFAGLPVAILDSISITQAFAARFDGRINPNGGNTTYVVQFGTDRNNLDQTGPVHPIESNGTSLMAEWSVIAGLTPGATYYATLAVTNPYYPTQRSDTLEFKMNHATIAYFNPDVTTPTTAQIYIGTNPHGHDKTGYVRYGTDPNNLDQTLVDPDTLTGTNLISRVLPLDGLTPDATYYSQWVVEDLNGGPTTYSEVVEFNTIFPTITIDSIRTNGQPMLFAYATVNTKNQPITIRGQYSHQNEDFNSQDNRYTVTVDGSTTPVQVVVPMADLELDEQHFIRLVATNPSNHSAYSDTVETDTYFVRYFEPSVFYFGADVVFLAELSAKPDLEYAYRLLVGTRADSLTAWNEFTSVTSPNLNNEIELLLSAEDLTPGTTYHFAIEGRGATGWITRSDTLSLLFQAPPYARTPVVQVHPDLTATLSTTFFPNGRVRDYQFVLGTSPHSLETVDVPVRISGTDSVVVSKTVGPLNRFSSYHLTLGVWVSSVSFLAITDTVTFETNIPYLSLGQAFNMIRFDTEGRPIVGFISGYVDNNGMPASVTIAYGTDRNNLDQLTDPVELDSESQTFEFGPLDPDTTYFASLIVTTDSHTIRSDTISTTTTYPTISLQYLQVNPSGGIYLLSTVDPNGFSGNYSMSYGTHPDSLNDSYSNRMFTAMNPPFDAGFELHNLDVTKTYYARLTATASSGDEPKFYASDLISWNFVLPTVLSSTLGTRQDLTAYFDATIDTKGEDLTVWAEGYNTMSASFEADTVSVSGSAEPVTVRIELGSYPRYSSGQAYLAVRATGKPVVYADTLSYSLGYPEFLDGANGIPAISNTNMLTTNLSYSNPGRATTLTMRYGYSGHPDSLVFSTAPITDQVFAGQVDRSMTIGPVIRNDSVFVQFGLESEGLQTWSPIKWVYSLGHDITIDTTYVIHTGEGTFAAVVTATVDPKGLPSRIRGFISDTTSFDGIAPSSETTFPSANPQQFIVTFWNLTIGQTYYAMVDATVTDTYSIDTASPIQTISFSNGPAAVDLAAQRNVDLTVDITGILYPLGRDLTYRVIYGTDPDNLDQSTDPIEVDGQAGQVAIDVKLPAQPRFSTVYAAILIESDGHEPIHSTTVGVVLNVPLVAYGSFSNLSNGDVRVPLTVDNGGQDISLWIEYGTDPEEFDPSTGYTELDGSDEPVPLVIDIPNRMVAGVLYFQVVVNVNGEFQRLPIQSQFTYAPSFTFDRAFARQDYVGVFEATVNPNGIPTSVKFEHQAGLYGTLTTDSLDLGDGKEPVAVQTTIPDLYVNEDYSVRMVVFGEDFSLASDTLYFNSRIPTVQIQDIVSSTVAEATLSVSLGSNGIDTYTRVAYGPVDGGFPDTTAAISRLRDDLETFDIQLSDLPIGATLEMKLIVQDQADLNKVAVSNIMTVTVKGLPALVELHGLVIGSTEEGDLTYTAVGRMNPRGSIVSAGLTVDMPMDAPMIILLEDPLSGNDWIDVEIPIPINRPAYKSVHDGHSTQDEEFDPLDFFPKARLFADTVYSAPIPIWNQRSVFFVTSNEDTETGVGQHGTLRYAMNEYTRLKNRSEQIDFSNTKIRMKSGPDTSHRSAFFFINNLIVVAIQDTITLTAPLPPILHSVGILGAHRDSTVIDGADMYRHFEIGSEAMAIGEQSFEERLSVGLGRMTLMNGRAQGGDGSDGAGGDAGMGGSILAHVGELSLSDLTLTRNTALGGSGSEVGPGTADGFVPYGAYGKGGAGASGPNTVPGGYGGFGGGAGANSAEIGLSGYGAGPATATRGGDGAGLGGAIYIRGDLNYVFMKNLSFVQNTAPNGSNLFLEWITPLEFDGVFEIEGQPQTPGLDMPGFHTLTYPDIEQVSHGFTTQFLGAESTRLSFQPGDGTHRLILVREATDSDDETLLPNRRRFLNTRVFASPVFGDERSFLGDGYFAVYAGTGHSVDISGLEYGTTYLYTVIEYTDDGSGGVVGYHYTPSLLEFTHVAGEMAADEAIGNALRLEAEDAPLPIGSASQDFLIGQNLTLDLWVKPDSVATSADLVSSGSDFTLRITEQGALEWASRPNGIRDSIRTSDQVVIAGRWTHVAVRATESEQQLLVNGTVRASRTLEGPITYGGSDPVALGGGFAGLLDEVRVFIGTPHISLIRNAMTMYTPNTEGGLTGYFQFNESGGDSTRNSATGYWKGGALTRVASDLVRYDNGYLYGPYEGGTADVGHLVFERVGGAPLPESDAFILISTAPADPDDVPTGHVALSDVMVFQPLVVAGSTYNLSFNQLPTPMSMGQINASQYRLYWRPLFSKGAWTLIAPVAGFAQLGGVFFQNVDQAGEFIVARDFSVSYDQIAGSAVRLDGVNDHIEFNHTAAMGSSLAYTVQMWFKTDDATRAVQFLTGKGFEYQEIHLTGNRSLRFIPRNGSFYDTAPNVIQSGVWTHLSATFDPSASVVKVYLNGVDMPLTNSGYNGTGFAGAYTTTQPLKVGIRSDGSFPYLGEVDEVRIWAGPRSALQVLDDMNHTSPNVIDETLLLYAQFNEGSGTDVNGNSGSPGSLMNMDDTEVAWVPSGARINAQAVHQARLTGQAGWRLLASPVATTVGDLLEGIWTQGFEGTTYPDAAPHVFTWNTANASNSASNWIPVSSASQALQPGEGLFAYVYATDPNNQGSFPKTLSVTGQGLRHDAPLTSRLNPNTNGWALVGNPYNTDIIWGDLARSGVYNVPYLWDANAEEWLTWNGSTGSLAGGRIGAFNGFFVATMSGNPSLSAPFTARRAGPNQFVGKITEIQAAATFSLRLEAPDGRSNRAWFSFDTNGKLGLDEHDAFKLAPYSQQYVQLASVIQDSIRLDINHLPILTEEVDIPLRIKSTPAGNYRLWLNANALPQGWDFAVIDTETGAMSRLTEALEFSWTGNGAESARFMLKLSPTTITSTEPATESPLVFGLDQNYPNPFNPSTVIRYTLDAGRHTRLTVYDVIGREVAVLVDGDMPSGRHSVSFDGSRLASGVYLYRLESGGKVLTRKFTLIK